MSDDVADAVQDAMLERLDDPKPNVRCAAVRALARLPIADEDGDFTGCPVTTALLDLLVVEKSKEVRKAIVASLPDAPVTRGVLLDRTRDESDEVRKVTYLSISEKLKLSEIGAQNGALLVGRGLQDRVEAVSEAAAAMVTSWLDGDCDGEPLTLLRMFEVEKHSKEAEMAMKSLIDCGRLNAVEIAKLAATEKLGLRANFGAEEVPLMSSEEALFWKIICESLSSEAVDKGLAAASTLGATASIEAAAAGDRLEALESAIPDSVEDMIDVVTVHANAGTASLFTCSQLISLTANCMDFTDATGRRAAASLLESLLSISGPAVASLKHTHEEAQEGEDSSASESGERTDSIFRESVSKLLRKVHGTPTEFAQFMLNALYQLCEDSGLSQGGDVSLSLWLHMLRCASAMLESLPNTKACMRIQSLFSLADVFHKLIEQGLHHESPIVRRDAVRCLGLYWLLDGCETPLHANTLRGIVLSREESYSVKTTAIQALGDLALQRGAKLLDRLSLTDAADEASVTEARVELFLNLLNNWQESFESIATKKRRRGRRGSSSTVTADDVESAADFGTSMVEALVRLIAVNEFRQGADAQRNEISALEDGEVLQILVALLVVSFDPISELAPKLRQCLTVFFERFASLSLTSQQYIATATIPAARLALSSDLVSGRKTASSNPIAPQVLRFVLQLLQLPVLRANGEREPVGHEPLAELVMGEILGSLRRKDVPKPYIAALCKLPLALPMYDAGDETRETMLRIQVYAASAIEKLQDRSMKKDMESVFQRYTVQGVDAPQLQPEEVATLLEGVEAHLEAFCSGFAVSDGDGQHEDARDPNAIDTSREMTLPHESTKIQVEQQAGAARRTRSAKARIKPSDSEDDDVATPQVPDHASSDEEYKESEDDDSDHEDEDEENFISKMSTAKARARRASAASVDALRAALQENVHIS